MSWNSRTFRRMSKCPNISGYLHVFPRIFRRKFKMSFLYIHCWTPISIKCHFQGRSSRLKIRYVRKDDGVDYLKPNTAINMLVWYVLGQFRLCVVSFRPHLMAVRDGFEYWLFCDDLLQNITRNPWLVNGHLGKPG